MARGEGSYIDDQGYPRISAGPCRGIRVHTLVAMGMLGRELREDEVVHHKDENKKNPWPSNLEVWDINHHNAHSAKQYWFLRKMKEDEAIEWKAFMAEQAAEDVSFPALECKD